MLGSTLAGPAAALSVSLMVGLLISLYRHHQSSTSHIKTIMGINKGLFVLLACAALVIAGRWGVPVWGCLRVWR